MKRIGGFSAVVLLLSLVHANAGERLYNGIELPQQWPPRLRQSGNKVMAVPYLEQRPKVVPIDVGRQLFVDDFLIEKSDLTREFHYPTRYEGNPILQPETPAELGQFAEKESNGNTKPMTAMISDGFCFDGREKMFKLWYQAGWRDGTNLAISKDGLSWTRPETDIEPGNNRVLPRTRADRHGTGISYDPFTTDASQRYKMLIFAAKKTQAYTSPDGIHWTVRGELPECGDNATAFYNPFRKKWVISIRVQQKARNGRARNYREHSDFLQAIHWTPLPDRASEIAASGTEVYEWAGTDPLDLPDPEMLAKIPLESKDKPDVRAGYGDPTQLYNLDAVAYESVMIGMFGILRGPTAGKVWDPLKIVKRNDLHIAYSRDGFYWDRPDRTPFIACTRKDGDWEAGYLHSGVGVLSVVEDQLYFYYSGWSGTGPKGPTTYAGGSTGVAMLRRDGFASLNAGETAATVTTRPLTFKGKYLFVNVDAPHGDLRTEVLDEQGHVIAPFDLEHSIAFQGDRTRQRLAWKGADDVAVLAGKTVRFRFSLRSAKLYSFWVSPDRSGASYGYVGAGGPGFDGLVDTVGSNASDSPRTAVKAPPAAAPAAGAASAPPFDATANATSTIPKAEFKYELTPEMVAAEQHYDQPLRPQIHYTPIQGHVGDATGLLHYKGQFHLFTMFDEWSRARQAHKRWGHAVSSDLVHWQQRLGLLDTDRDHHPGSGGGVVDFNNSSGLQSGAEKTLVLFYTDYARGTCITFSHDAGQTWKYYGENPVLPGVKEIRDPYVFWHGPTKQWCMVRYEHDGYAFYDSADLIHWKPASRIEGFHECPDLIELAVEGTAGQRKWVLVNANGEYLIGAFDGKRFSPDSEKKQRVNQGGLYAMQSWKVEEAGRPSAIQVAWTQYPLNEITQHLTWNGHTSFPNRLSLVAVDRQIRLRAEPVRQLAQLYDGSRRFAAQHVQATPQSNPLEPCSLDVCEIILDVSAVQGDRFTLALGGTPIECDLRKRIVVCAGKKAAIPGTAPGIRLQILVDRPSLDIYIDHGLATLTRVCFPLASPDRRMSIIPADQGRVEIEKLEVNYLKSIWPKP